MNYINKLEMDNKLYLKEIEELKEKYKNVEVDKALLRGAIKANEDKAINCYNLYKEEQKKTKD